MPVLARLQQLSNSPDERRRAPRLLLKLGATVGSGSTAVVHDISTRGLLFETATQLDADRIHVHLPELPAAGARIVWTHGRFYGCEFEEPIPTASVSNALLRSEPKAPFAPLAGQSAGKAAEAPSFRFSIAGTLGAALVLGGAAWLAIAGHWIALAAVVIGVIALIALLAAVAGWALDNSSDLRL